MSPIIVWFRQDLRLKDNPALVAAAKTGRPLVCLYILDEDAAGTWRIGAASRWWLHGALVSLAHDIETRGAKLVLRRGPACKVLDALIAESGATQIVWNRCYEPHAVARDTAIKDALTARGLVVDSFGASLLAEPWDIVTASGTPYRVFTPFWRKLRERMIATPLRAPAHLASLPAALRSDTLQNWNLRPRHPDWATGLRAAWTPGEPAAQAMLQRFVARADDYAAMRDNPAIAATSRLSAHLHWGEISPRQIWHAVTKQADRLCDRGDKFLSELAWRDFAHHLLFHNPCLPDAPLDRRFASFPWSDNDSGFDAWCQGRTGIPIVDAGMRELWQTGWMHNRVRMIAASFLIKHLMIDWRRGETWFWDTLVDADLANNATGWQWVAGCGADAAPFFRVFNPVLQGEKFDPDGAYVRRFVPELAALDKRHIHKPWTAPTQALSKAGITLGRNYAMPIVDLAEGRARALAAFRALATG